MPKSPFETLVRDGILTRDALAAAVRHAADQRMSVGWILVHENKIPLEAVGKALSAHYRVPFVAYREDLTPLQGVVDRVPVDLCTFSRVAPVGRENKKLVLLMADPGDLPLKDQLEGHLGESFVVRVSLPEDIHRLLTGVELRPWVPAPEPDPASMTPEEERTDLADVVEESESAIVSMVNALVMKCLREKVEEIRIDPRQKPPSAWRVGAEWKDLLLPETFHQDIVRRFKVMANLDIGNRAKLQKGSFELATGAGRRRFAVSVEPVGGGDEAVRVMPS